MCVKLLPIDLYLGLCLPHLTSIYTCGVTTTPRVCSGKIVVNLLVICFYQYWLPNFSSLTCRVTYLNEGSSRHWLCWSICSILFSFLFFSFFFFFLSKITHTDTGKSICSILFSIQQLYHI